MVQKLGGLENMDQDGKLLIQSLEGLTDLEAA